MYNLPAAQSQMRIDRLIMARGEKFPDQYRRPYETVATGETVNNIVNRLEQLSSVPGNVTATMLGNAAAGFVHPSAEVESKIYIPNGWQTQRFYYCMEVSFISPMGTQRQLIQGYSDHADVSHNGTLDPRTIFVINSIINIGVHRERQNGQLVTYQTVNDAVHVLTDHQYGNYDNAYANNNKLLAMRPSDLFHNMSLREQNEDYVTEGMSLSTRNLVTGQPKASSRRHALPGEYAGRVLSGYGMGVTENHFGASPSEHFNTAMTHVAEGVFTNNKFMTVIQNAKGMGAHHFSDQFTWSDLLRVDPTVDDRTVIMVPGEAQRLTAASPFQFDASYSADWGGRQLTDIAASILSSGIPGLIVGAGLCTVHFTATNHYNGQPMFAFVDVKGIVEQSVVEALPNLQNRIMQELIAPISMNGELSFDIEVRCDLYYSTTISIRNLGDYGQVDYVAPTFADALTAPVITTSSNRMNNISQDFQNLVETVVQVTPETNFSTGFQGAIGSSGTRSNL